MPRIQDTPDLAPRDATATDSRSHDAKATMAAVAILPAVYDTDETGRRRLVRPAEPCPELLTQEEAALYLRLRVTNAGDSLRYYRQRHGLRAVQISRQVLYPREELSALWRRLMDKNPR